MKRPVVFVVLASVAALLASVLVYSTLRNREAEVRKATAGSVEIVVAARDLPLGTKIDASTLKMTRWSRDSIPPGAFTDQAQILAGSSYVKNALVENEPIVASKLFMGGEKSAGVLPLLIPTGMRAMSVPVDEVSDIAGFVLPHARVDVLVSLSNAGGGGGAAKAFSKLVLQNIEVLAVAQEVEGKRDEPDVVKVVTLLVTPQEAERLALASHEGTLRLAMRNYTDDKIVMTSGSDIENLLHSFATVPVMAHQPYLPRLGVRAKPRVEIEIMRDGKSRQSVSFVSEASGSSYSERRTASAQESEGASAASDPEAADGKTAKAPAAAANEEPAVERTDDNAGFAPVRKTIDVP